MTYVLDTNIVSYALRGDRKIYAEMKRVLDLGGQLVLPYVVHYEIVRWLLELGATAKQREFEALCQSDMILDEVSFEVWQKAAKLYVQTRKKGIQPGDADLLIAAFCVVHNFVLVTNNVKDFEIIDGLEIVNWKI